VRVGFGEFLSSCETNSPCPLGTGSFTAVVNVPVNPDLPRFIAMDGDGPRFGAMIGLVAVVVATVILVFFGIGYALGRLFL
jgi:hypothetical protein